MSGWSSAESRIKNLGKKAEVVDRGRQVSVVYMDEDGVIDWPPHPAPGILLIPHPVSEPQWVEKYGQQGG